MVVFYAVSFDDIFLINPRKVMLYSSSIVCLRGFLYHYSQT